MADLPLAGSRASLCQDAWGYDAYVPPQQVLGLQTLHLLLQLSGALGGDTAPGTGTDPLVETGTALVEGCLQHVGVDGALVLARDMTGACVQVAASPDWARTWGSLELQQQDGPALTALRTGAIVSFGVAAPPASGWPSLDAAARQVGLGESCAVPLRRGASVVGAVQVFVRAGRSVREYQWELLQALADSAAAGIVTRRLIDEMSERNAQLQMALSSRIVLEQAKGILAARTEMPVAQAFDFLRQRARQERRSLHDVAEDLVRQQQDGHRSSNPTR